MKTSRAVQLLYLAAMTSCSSSHETRRSENAAEIEVLVAREESIPGDPEDTEDTEDTERKNSEEESPKVNQEIYTNLRVWLFDFDQIDRLAEHAAYGLSGNPSAEVDPGDDVAIIAPQPMYLDESVLNTTPEFELICKDPKSTRSARSDRIRITTTETSDSTSVAVDKVISCSMLTLRMRSDSSRCEFYLSVASGGQETFRGSVELCKGSGKLVLEFPKERS